MCSRTLSPRVSKLRLRRVSSSCPSKGAWDKGAVRRNLITTRCGSERSWARTQALDDQRLNWIMMKIRACDWCGFFLVLGGAPRFHSNFTDKAPFWADLSVSKTHFTDKPSFFGDLSVNFWPLWWRFTDKAGFLEHLSVKPGPNRLNFYGQKAVFDHFVRNRHFSGRPFTDKLPIFIDLSVNGSDFEFVLLSRSRALNFDQPVDKKEAFLPVFVYFRGHTPQFWPNR